MEIIDYCSSFQCSLSYWNKYVIPGMQYNVSLIYITIFLYIYPIENVNLNFIRTVFFIYLPTGNCYVVGWSQTMIYTTKGHMKYTTIFHRLIFL